MNGFADPNILAWIPGRQVEQLCIGENEIILRLHPAGAITVTGAWELIDPAGRVLDRAMEHSARTESRLHYVIGSPATAAAAETARSAVLRFANGWSLRLIDDDPRFEAVVLEPGDGRSLVV